MPLTRIFDLLVDPAVSAATGACAVLLALAFWLRVPPRALRGAVGIDRWFYLLCADDLHRRRRLPVRLPHYLLDIEEQWYPPGHAIFLALLPARFRGDLYWCVSPLVDCALGGCLAWWVAALSRSALAGVIALALYAITPALIEDCQTGSSRAMGNLVSFLCLGSLVMWPEGRPAWLWASAVFFVALLFTHKLSMQNAVALVVMAALWERDWRYGAWAAGLVLVAIAISGGHYLSILRGHLDILWFWNKHHENLGAHMIYDSPVYAHLGRQARGTRFYRPGLAGVVHNLRQIIVRNWLIGVVPLAVPMLRASELASRLTAIWILGTYAMVFATTFLSTIKLLGEGHKYVKLVAPPLCAFAAVLACSHPWAAGYVALLAALNIRSLIHVRRAGAAAALQHVGTELTEVLEVIKDTPGDGVVCLPVHHADAVAWFCGKRVFWGAHSSGYDKLQDFFPVLRRPLAEYFRLHPELDLLLLNTGYVQESDLALSGFEPLATKGSFKLFRYDRAAGAAESSGGTSTRRAPAGTLG